MPQRTSRKKKAQPHPQDTSHMGQIFAGQSHPLHHQSAADPAKQTDFYEQYKRVLGISHQIQKQMRSHHLLNEQLIEKIAQLQKNMQNIAQEPIEKHKSKSTCKKRSRRMAQQIERQYKCNVQYCEKQYGSQGSLMQHIKLKHPQMYYAKI